MFFFSIYDQNGIEIDKIGINDDIEYLDGRVHKGKRSYYKGVGVPYDVHAVSYDMHIDTNQYELLRDSDIFYLGNIVRKKCFVGKKGVFQELFQPYYPDFIGSCSVKEGPLVINSITFERSSVEVYDCIEFDTANQQYYYTLDYKCNRQQYVNQGNPSDLRELLDFMVVNDWNFLWDKKAINDISYDGRVSDVADIFKSDTLSHKLGTVYSVLYSLGQLYPHKYNEFLFHNNLTHENDSSFVFNSVLLLDQNGVDISELFPFELSEENYKFIIKHYLITGKNCAYCACDLFIDQGDAVRDNYLNSVRFN